MREDDCSQSLSENGIVRESQSEKAGPWHQRCLLLIRSPGTVKPAGQYSEISFQKPTRALCPLISGFWNPCCVFILKNPIYLFMSHGLGVEIRGQEEFTLSFHHVGPGVPTQVPFSSNLPSHIISFMFLFVFCFVFNRGSQSLRLSLCVHGRPVQPHY